MGQAEMVTAPQDASLTAADNAVEVRHLEKRYKRTVALRDISLDVHRGEIFGLIGPDGSGKSSLIRAISGVQQYDSGSITVLGRLIDSERSAETIKGRIGLMPQGLGNNLYAELSIDENIDYFAGLRLVQPDVLKRRKDRLLELTRLIDFRDRPMKQLSGGMKQKLGLVCTLIHQPALVLLDEPTTGVDPVSRRDFWSILTELVHESGMTAIVSTAYMDETDYMNRLALFMEGRILSQGKEEDLQSLVSGTIVSLPTREGLATADRVRTRYPQVQTLGDLVRVFVPVRNASSELDWISEISSIARRELRTSIPDLDDVLACLLSDQASRVAGTSAEPSGSTPETSMRVSPTPFPSAHPMRPGPVESSPIRARELVRDFGKFRAVDGVSFEVSSGQIFGLLGANGAGKTTVIKMLTGLLPPTAGSGSVAGADNLKASQTIRERIGYMSQSFSLYLDMTAMENLEFYAGVYGLFPSQRRQRIPDLLRKIGLEGYEGRLTSDLPMGIRQRLALGCALVHEPRVIFLDEPTSGVDVLGRRQFWDILVRLARQDGVAILVTTHYMAEAEHCDDLALMYAGRVIAAGSPSGLREDLERDVGEPLGMVTSSPLDALRVAKQNGFRRATLFGHSMRILTRDREHDERRLRGLFAENQITVIDTQLEAVTMEDVFVDSILSEEEKAGQLAQESLT